MKRKQFLRYLSCFFLRNTLFATRFQYLRFLLQKSNALFNSLGDLANLIFASANDHCAWRAGNGFVRAI